MTRNSSTITPSETSTAAQANCLAGGGEMGALMRALDWSQTFLGAVTHWPQPLCTAVSICLNSRYPMLIWWGKDLVMLYNDAYRPILGRTKHPRALGQRGAEVWPEIWSIIGPMLAGVLERGEATWSEDQLLLLDRNGYLEECYFTFSYSPLRGVNVDGVFTAVTETTARVLSERRLRILRELAACATETRSAEQACAVAADILASNRQDLPFTFIYLLDADGRTAALVGASGVRAGSPACPTQVELTNETEPFTLWPLAKVMQTGQAEHVSQLGAHFTDLPKEPWGAPPASALVAPIGAQSSGRPAGFLIAGLSPRRTLDDDYCGFLDLVVGQMATTISNARAYEEERKRVAALAALDRAKTIFFNNISHEFRTPLTLILGPAEDALADHQEPLAPGQRSRLELLHRNGLRLLKLVNTLLDFARLEAGRVEAVYEETDLAAFTAELASVFRSAIEKAGLRLLVDCPPIAAPTYVDKGMWEKIVLNLLSNALKFTFTGEIRVTLRLINTPSMATANGAGLNQKPSIELEVRDTGVGIPPEALPHLFERFYRVAGAQARTQEGSGIGLALVQELVRLHSGTVEVNSQVGEGSAFYVTIPTGEAHLPADRVNATRTLQSTALNAMPYVEEALRWLPVQDAALEREQVNEMVSAPRLPPSTPHATRSKRILIADDNADLREYLARLLKPWYTVELVGDGTAALQALHHQLPDLVLADIMMPRLDGLELLHALRQQEETRNLPVILLSARAGEANSIEGLASGADDYLVKPFSAAELLARIDARLTLKQVQQAAAEQLRQREERYRLAARATNDAIWDWDLSTDQVEWNAAIATLFGHTAAIQGTNAAWWHAHIHPEDEDRVRQSIQAVIQGRDERWTEEYRFRCANGAYAYVFDRGFVLRAPAGQPLRMIGAMLDVTARKQDEAALLHLNQTLEQRVVERTAELKQRNLELDQFAYVASHDLRAPLRAIDHLATWIEQDAGAQLPGPSLTHLITLRNRVKRMENLLNDLLAYSRAGRMQHQLEMVDTRDLVTDIVKFLAPPETFTVAPPEGLPILTTERVPLELVLRNLISNAIKHHDRFDGHIAISAQAAGDFIEFTVTDDGPGIAPMYHERIFQMFQTLKPRDLVEGSGMGLAIVKRMVESRKGKIQVESSGERGTTFRFTWPM
ncbi:MAG: ATP-binding protein [Caldilineaceae bacterium]